MIRVNSSNSIFPKTDNICLPHGLSVSNARDLLSNSQDPNYMLIILKNSTVYFQYAGHHRFIYYAFEIFALEFRKVQH